MSWILSNAFVNLCENLRSLQEPVGESSAVSSLGGEQSAQLKLSHTPNAYLPADKMKVYSRLSRFGMTFEPLKESRGEDLLTWYLEDSRAKTSPPPEKVQALLESDLDSGPKWRELSVKYDHATSSWKIPHYLSGEDSKSFSKILPRWGMMRDGVLWERITPALPTNATASGLWPTPNQRDWRDSGPNQGNRKSPNLGTMVHRFATPQARDFRTGQQNRWENPERTRNPNDQIGGKLNPTWVEWLMGWPLGWTELRPSGMDKFQQWLRLHGRP